MLREANPWFGCKGGFMSLETGMGKTLVILVLIYLDRYATPQHFQRKAPTIVVCGIDIMGEWFKAIAQFFKPGTFRTLVVGEKGKVYREEEFYNYDIVFVNYAKMAKIFKYAVTETAEKCTHEVIERKPTKQKAQNRIIPPKREWIQNAKIKVKVPLPNTANTPMEIEDNATESDTSKSSSSNSSSSTAKKASAKNHATTGEISRWIESRVVFAPLYDREANGETCVLCKQTYQEDTRCNLFKVRWRRVVCDEAHEIRACNSDKFMGCIALHADCFWASTASPMQNRSEDLYALFRLVRFSHPAFIRLNPSPMFETVKRLPREFFTNAINAILLYRNKTMMENSLSLEMWPREIMEFIKDKDPMKMFEANQNMEKMINDMVAGCVRERGLPAFERGIMEDRVDQLTYALRDVTKMYQRVVYESPVVEQARREYQALKSKPNPPVCQERNDPALALQQPMEVVAKVDEIKEEEEMDLFDLYDSVHLPRDEKSIESNTNATNSSESNHGNDPLEDDEETAPAEMEYGDDAPFVEPKMLGTLSNYYVFTSDFVTEEERLIYQFYDDILKTFKKNLPQLVNKTTGSKIKAAAQVAPVGKGNSRCDIFACFSKLREVCVHPLLALITRKREYKAQNKKDLDYKCKEVCVELLKKEWSTMDHETVEFLYDKFISEEFISTKMKMLEGYLKSFVKPDEKFIIYSNFSDTLTIYSEFIEKHLGMKCVIMSGGKTQQERVEILNAFDKDDSIRGMVANMKMCANGLNLQRANHAIIVDTWWNPEIERQALNRIDRITQTRIQNKVYLIIRGTLEEKVHKVATLKCQDIFLTMGKTTMKDRMALLGCSDQEKEEERARKWNLSSEEVPPALSSRNLPVPVVFAKDPWKLFVFSHDRNRVVRSMEESNYDYYTIKLGDGRTFNASNYMDLSDSRSRKSKGKKTAGVESVLDVILYDMIE